MQFFLNKTPPSISEIELFRDGLAKQILESKKKNEKHDNLFLTNLMIMLLVPLLISVLGPIFRASDDTTFILCAIFFVVPFFLAILFIFNSYSSNTLTLKKQLSDIDYLCPSENYQECIQLSNICALHNVTKKYYHELLKMQRIPTLSEYNALYAFNKEHADQMFLDDAENAISIFSDKISTKTDDMV